MLINPSNLQILMDNRNKALLGCIGICGLFMYTIISDTIYNAFNPLEWTKQQKQKVILRKQLVKDKKKELQDLIDAVYQKAQMYDDLAGFSHSDQAHLADQIGYGGIFRPGMQLELKVSTSYNNVPNISFYIDYGLTSGCNANVSEKTMRKYLASD